MVRVPIEVTNSVAGAGVYEVSGVDENGDAQDRDTDV